MVMGVIIKPMGVFTVFLVLGVAMAQVCAPRALAGDSCNFPQPPKYIAYKMPEDSSLVIDGKMDDAEWEEVPWSRKFIDIEGDGFAGSRSCRTNDDCKPRFETRFKMRYDDEYLYVAAKMEDTDLWGDLTVHNSVIFQNPDFEIFVDPFMSNHLYKEWEINQLNTTWDLILAKPYCNGPKGCGHQVLDKNCFEMPGLKSAVHLSGTINQNDDTDEFWSMEVALPLDGLTSTVLEDTSTQAQRVIRKPELPPKKGNLWKINFSRVQWIVAKNDTSPTGYSKSNGEEDNWVWASQDAVNMHLPEQWGYLMFSDDEVSQDLTAFQPDPDFASRAVLMQTYYALTAHDGVTDKLDDLELPSSVANGNCASVPEIHTTKSCACVSTCDSSGGGIRELDFDWCKVDDECVNNYANNYFILYLDGVNGETIRYDKCENDATIAQDGWAVSVDLGQGRVGYVTKDRFLHVDPLPSAEVSLLQLSWAEDRTSNDLMLFIGIISLVFGMGVFAYYWFVMREVPLKDEFPGFEKYRY